MANTDKIWFILIGGRKEGPYSICDLKRDLRITPDTLVWRSGFNEWVRAKTVWELAALFDDAKPETSEKDSQPPGVISPDGLVIGMEEGEPPPFFWMTLLLLLLLYFVLRMNYM